MPTPRLLFLLLLAAPPGAVGGPLALLAVAIAALAVFGACVDWFLAADGRRIQTRRVLTSDKFSLGAWNPVEVHLANHGARVQHVTVRDIPPADFVTDGAATMATTLAGGAEHVCTYRVRPPHRGDARFDDLFLRVDGPLGLVRRAFRQRGTADSVKVYPDLRELRRYDLLVRRGLEARPGGRALRVAGASTEFERVRDYLPDDEFRRVNWTATARRGQPMVNQFEAERSQNLVILLDVGRSMAALAEANVGLATPLGAVDDDTAPGLTRLDYAVNAAQLLAYVASLRGDRVALLAYADDMRIFVPLQRGRRALLSTVGALYNLRAEPVEPDHGRAFDFLAARNLRRSLVVLFTDLADRESSSALAPHIVRAARQHLVVCVTLADPSVRRPAQQTPADGRGLYEKMVAQQLLDDRAAVLAQLAAYGVLTIDTDADKLHPSLIGAYLEVKERGRL